jgi:hypothetical protein
MILRLLLLALNATYSLDFLLWSLKFNQGLNQIEKARVALMQNPESARRQYCQLDWPLLAIEQRVDGAWTDSCALAAKGSGSLARYWSLSLSMKYRVLFLYELPIYMSIKIYC